MVAGSNAKTLLIDGCEDDYEWQKSDFQREYEQAYGTDVALHYTIEPHIYQDAVRVGLPINMQVEKNLPAEKHFRSMGAVMEEANAQAPAPPSPEQLEQVILDANEVSHGYIWFYPERGSWWLPKSGNFGEGVLSREDFLPLKDYWLPLWRAMSKLKSEG